MAAGSKNESSNEPNAGTETNYRGCGTCCNKVIHDKAFRRQWFYTVCIESTFFILGWVKGQFGPSFLDLLSISDTSLANGSWIVTLYYIGYVIGSIIGGVIYKLVDPLIQFVVCLLLLAMVHVLIPWCFLFELMLVSHCCKGIIMGVIDTFGIAEIFRLWKSKGGTHLLGVNIVFSGGTMLSSLVTAPFLREITNENPKHKLNESEAYNSTTLSSNVNEMSTFPEVITEHSQIREDTDVYIAYLITATLSALISCIYIVLYCTRPKTRNSSSAENEQISTNVRQLPLPVKIFALIVSGSALFIFSAIEEGFFAYFSAFCVDYFHWTKKDAAFAISLVSGIAASTRLVFICLVAMVKPIIIIVTLTIILVLDTVGFSLVAMYQIDIGVWIVAGVFGFAQSLMDPVIFGWANETFFPVNGKIASFFMIATMMGGALNPLLLSYLMEHITKLAFPFTFLVQSVIFLLTILIGAVLSRFVIKSYGLTYKPSQSNENEIELLAR